MGVQAEEAVHHLVHQFQVHVLRHLHLFNRFSQNLDDVVVENTACGETAGGDQFIAQIIRSAVRQSGVERILRDSSLHVER